VRAADAAASSLGALGAHRLRSALSALGIAIGVGAVILLTSLGEGVRTFASGEFKQFGTNLLQVTPGKTETFGRPGALGGTTHKLTIDDAEALRRVHGVTHVVSVASGQARVEAGERGRSVYVWGVTHEVPEVWGMDVVQGTFLPAGDPRRADALCVLGPKLKRELFGDANAVGDFVRAGGWRLRVAGVMAPKGNVLGLDLDDAVWVPAATALRMFDLEQLSEIDVSFARADLAPSVVSGVEAALRARHDGADDVTVVTQDAMLDVLDKVLRAVALGVVAIAAISILVGATGVLTVVWIAVGERTAEIGLLRALGATTGDVFRLFLFESAVLAGLGGAAGLAAGLGLARLLGLFLPRLAVDAPWPAIAAALLGSVLTGLAAGVLPARRAARLDPVLALREE
jgi:putative ABC transport system permease protein